MSQIISFGEKHGPLYPAVPTVDCRSLRNPHSFYSQRDGRDPQVQRYVYESPGFSTKMAEAELIFQQYGKVAFKCYGGRHRSVAMAEAFAAKHGLKAVHRDLPAPSAAPASAGGQPAGPGKGHVAEAEWRF